MANRRRHGELPFAGGEAAIHRVRRAHHLFLLALVPGAGHAANAAAAGRRGDHEAVAPLVRAAGLFFPYSSDHKRIIKETPLNSCLPTGAGEDSCGSPPPAGLRSRGPSSHFRALGCIPSGVL